MGDSRVGKTAFISMHHTERPIERYIAWEKRDPIPICFYTNYGPIRFNMRENHINDEYLGLVDGFIVIFDVSRPKTFTNIIQRGWKPKLPFVLIGNKRNKNKSVNDISIKDTFFGSKYVGDISVKTERNFREHLLALAKQLLNKDDVKFEKVPPLESDIAFFSKTELLENQNNNDIVFRDICDVLFKKCIPFEKVDFESQSWGYTFNPSVIGVEQTLAMICLMFARLKAKKLYITSKFGIYLNFDVIG